MLFCLLQMLPLLGYVLVWGCVFDDCCFVFIVRYIGADRGVDCCALVCWCCCTCLGVLAYWCLRVRRTRVYFCFCAADVLRFVVLLLFSL